MTTTASSDTSLIPSVAQFHLRLHYYCRMYIMAPAQKILLPLCETVLQPHKCRELEGAAIALSTESVETSGVLHDALAAA